MIGSCISNEDKRYKRKNAAYGKIRMPHSFIVAESGI